MRIFQQAGTAHGKRPANNLEKSEEILCQPRGQLCGEKSLQNVFVGSIAQGQRIEVVGSHELIENVGAQDHGARNGNRQAFEIVAHGILLDYGIHERQAAPFAAKTALAYAREVGIVVETVFLEHRHHAAVLHLAVLHDKVEEQPLHCRRLLYSVELVAPHHIGYREERTAVEPAGDIVT